MTINSPRRLNIFLSVALLVGYVWVGIQLLSDSFAPAKHLNVCMIKEVTTIPCPSCGATRSVEHLISGDLQGALYWNPFGIIIAIILIIAPFWMIYDAIMKRRTLFNSYIRIENFLKNKWIAAAAIILVLANWIWNITKGL